MFGEAQAFVDGVLEGLPAQLAVDPPSVAGHLQMRLSWSMLFECFFSSVPEGDLGKDAVCPLG